MSKRLIILLIGCTVSTAAVTAEPIKQTDWQVLYAVDGKFEDTRENVELAITDQGLVINNVSHVGSMLETTGSDLGFDRKVYVHGEVLEFCSATLSREMTEADPANIVFCPYTIQVYEVPETPGTIYVGYRRLPLVGNDASRQALSKVDELLNRIVTQALSW